MTEKVVTTKTETVRTKSVDGMHTRAQSRKSDETLDLRSKTESESGAKNKAEKFAEKYGLAVVLIGTMAVAGYLGYKYLDNKDELNIAPIEESCPSNSFEIPGVERGESEFPDWKLDGVEISANANPDEVYNAWLNQVIDEDSTNLFLYAQMVNGFYLDNDSVSQEDKDFKKFLDNTSVEDLSYQSNSLTCASNKAVDIVNYIKSKKVDVSIIENVSEIPGVSSVRNTSVKDGALYENNTVGIDLEGRNALLVTYRDENGDKIGAVGVAGTCGNPFILVPPVYHPPVYTTPKPPVYHPPVYVPKPKLEEKNPSQDPVKRDNAEIGGGKNETKGPGEFESPSTIEKEERRPESSKRRENPEPPTTTEIPIGSTPDDTYPSEEVREEAKDSGYEDDYKDIPKPEKNAPTPENPATETVAVPGM